MSLVNKMKLSVLMIISSVFVIGQEFNLSQFGLHGNNTSTFMGEKMPTHFFSKSFANDLINRKDFSGSYDMKKRLASLRESGSQLKRVDLNVASQTETRLTLVVSCLKRQKTVNFFIEVEPFNELKINASELTSYDEIQFVCMADFSVSIDLGTNSRVLSDNISVLSPVQTEAEWLNEEESWTSASAYCSYVNNFRNCNSTWTIRVYIEHPARPDDIKTAWVERIEVRKAICDDIKGCLTDARGRILYPQGSDSVPAPIFNLNVYHPTSSALWHDGKPHDSWTCSIPGWCLRTQYATTSKNNGNVLKWMNLNNYTSPKGDQYDIEDSFEEVLFERGCGVAFCAPETQPGGSTCAISPNEFWYVYSPGYRCNY